MSALIRGYSWLRGAAYVVLASPAILIPGLRDRLASGITGIMGRVAYGLWVYAAFWAVVWAITALVVPTWFTGTTGGLETALQVLPAVLVAILVLILGSVAVIAQMSAATWGTRAPVLLSLDVSLQTFIVRPLLLLVAVLLLAGQVPDSGTPSDLVTAAVGALSLATLVVTVRAALYLPAVAVHALAPRNFSLRVLDRVLEELSCGQTGMVVFRVGLLSEALRSAIRREDNVGAMAILEAMRDLHCAYLQAMQVLPEIRNHELDLPGERREGWLVGDLSDGLVQAGNQVLRDFADHAISDQISLTLASIGDASIEAGQPDDAELVVDSFIRLGTTPNQVTPGGFINWHGPPPEKLAGLSGHARENRFEELGTRALAGWALVTAYPWFHFGFGGEHPTWRHCIELLGKDPPWEDAKALVCSEDWTGKWANQQHNGPLPVVTVILTAENWDPESEESVAFRNQD